MKRRECEFETVKRDTWKSLEGGKGREKGYNYIIISKLKEKTDSRDITWGYSNTLY